MGFFVPLPEADARRPPKQHVLARAVELQGGQPWIQIQLHAPAEAPRPAV